MKFKFLFLPLTALFILAPVSLWAQSGPYSIEALQQMTKDQLIILVMQLQGNGSTTRPQESCTQFRPLLGESGQILTRLQHQGYSDDGTLSWPNGKIFMLRHAQYGDDKELHYPDGNLFIRSHAGYNDDHELLWPNQVTILTKHAGYGDDGTIRRHDGSVMLLRHSGYSDDHQRTGLPIDRLSSSGFETVIRLNPDDSVGTSVVQETVDYRVSVNYLSNSEDLIVRECLK